MRAIITVIGKDKIGIISKVSNVLAEHSVNILDINQTIMQEIFTMVMLVDLKKLKSEFSELSNLLNETGNELGLSIRIQREEIFNSMHRI